MDGFFGCWLKLKYMEKIKGEKINLSLLLTYFPHPKAVIGHKFIIL